MCQVLSKKELILIKHEINAVIILMKHLGILLKPVFGVSGWLRHESMGTARVLGTRRGHWGVICEK